MSGSADFLLEGKTDWTGKKGKDMFVSLHTHTPNSPHPATSSSVVLKLILGLGYSSVLKHVLSLLQTLSLIPGVPARACAHKTTQQKSTKPTKK